MILFFWKKSNSLRTCGNLKENDNFFLCNNESKISFIFIYKIILKQYQSMSNWFLKLLWIERRGQAQFATTTKLFSLWKWERLMHNIQKSFPFPVASECQSSSILELWVVVVVTWFSFAKHNYPIVGCYWRLGRTLGIWDWCSLQPRAKMSQSGHLMARSLDNQMARCPDGQMSGWLDVRMARRTVGKKSLWLYGLYI